jgi:hypothetical protein
MMTEKSGFPGRDAPLVSNAARLCFCRSKRARKILAEESANGKPVIFSRGES